MLLEEGFQVTSVDASDKMLKYALKERWERRKEESFDRWGAGGGMWVEGGGGPCGHQHPNPCTGESGLSPSRGSPGPSCTVPCPSPVLGHLAWVLCRPGGLAAGTGRDLPEPAVRQAQAMALACLLAPGRIRRPQGPGIGWVMLGWGGVL